MGSCWAIALLDKWKVYVHTTDPQGNRLNCSKSSIICSIHIFVWYHCPRLSKNRSINTYNDNLTASKSSINQKSIALHAFSKSFNSILVFPPKYMSLNLIDLPVSLEYDPKVNFVTNPNSKYEKCIVVPPLKFASHSPPFMWPPHTAAYYTWGCLKMKGFLRPINDLNTFVWIARVWWGWASFTPPSKLILLTVRSQLPKNAQPLKFLTLSLHW